MSGMSSEPTERGHFRPDIEGLRAIAIIAVLLYHVGLPGVPGGFVGVDIFYVISGFLITGLLVRELTATDRLDFVMFYARRGRRLLPAALIVIVVTLIASAAVLSQLRFPDVAGDAAASALDVVNFRFALSATDYLAAGGAPSPYQHYWSLAVEEQFYFVWPLFILIGTRLVGLRRVALPMLLLTVLSLALSVTWTDISEPWAFFSLPTRAWELGIGALIALGLLRLPARAPNWFASGVGWVGLGLTAFAIVWINGGMPYPGTVAVIPVAGAAMLIVGGQRSGVLPSRLLATRVPRWFGRISYSLYLWHWPLLVLVPIALGDEGLPLKLGLAGVAIVIAAISTDYIEAPIRDRRVLKLAPSRSVAVALASSAIVAVVALAYGGILPGMSPGGPLTAGGPPATLPPLPTLAPLPTSTPRVSRAPHRTPAPNGSGTGSHPTTEPSGDASSPTPTEVAEPPLPSPLVSGPLPNDLQPTLRQARDDLPRSYADGCHLDFTTVSPPPCVYGDPASATTVVLFGDSHAAQWLPALERIAQARDWRIVSLTKSGCPPANVKVWNVPLDRLYRECDDWRANVLDRIAAERPALVIVGAARDYQIVDDAGQHDFADALPAWKAGLEDTFGALTSRADRVVFMGDTPRRAKDPLECLATHSDVADCTAPRAANVDRSYADLEAGAASDTGVEYISPTDWLCTADACPLVMGSYLVYRDTNHLTATFSAVLAAQLNAALGDVP